MNKARFSEAIRNHDIATLKRLLEKEPDLVNSRNSGSTKSWLDLCFQTEEHDTGRDCECLELLVHHGADINERYWKNLFPQIPKIDDGFTPVMFAVKVKCLRCIRFLIEKGADLSITSRLGHTALNMAVTYGTNECASALIQHCTPAVINHKHKGMTALMWAVKFYRERDTSLIHQVIAAGADLSIANTNGSTALILSVKSRKKANIEAIIQHSSSALINQRDEKGRTALMWAAAKCYEELGSSVCEQLIEAGAGVNLEDNYCYTALSIACKMENNDAVSLLLQKGAIVNIISLFGKTPLYYAFKLKQLSVINQLFQKGADPSFSLKHTAFINKTISNMDIKTLRMLVMNGFPPEHCTIKNVKFLSYTMFLRIFTTPFTIALWKNQPATARYLIINKFFTRSDIDQTSPQITELRERLQGECLQILEFHLQTVQTLTTLCLITISSALTQDFREDNVKEGAFSTEWQFTPTFKERVERLELPRILQKALLHQTPSSRICCKHWENISLAEERQFPDCNECDCYTDKVKNYENEYEYGYDSDGSDSPEPDFSDTSLSYFSDSSDSSSFYESEMSNVSESDTVE